MSRNRNIFGITDEVELDLFLTDVRTDVITIEDFTQTPFEFKEQLVLEVLGHGLLQPTREELEQVYSNVEKLFTKEDTPLGILLNNLKYQLLGRAVAVDTIPLYLKENYKDLVKQLFEVIIEQGNVSTLLIFNDDLEKASDVLAEDFGNDIELDFKLLDDNKKDLKDRISNIWTGTHDKLSDISERIRKSTDSVELSNLSKEYKEELEKQFEKTRETIDNAKEKSSDFYSDKLEMPIEKSKLEILLAYDFLSDKIEKAVAENKPKVSGGLQTTKDKFSELREKIVEQNKEKTEIKEVSENEKSDLETLSENLGKKFGELLAKGKVISKDVVEKTKYSTDTLLDKAENTFNKIKKTDRDLDFESLEDTEESIHDLLYTLIESSVTERSVTPYAESIFELLYYYTEKEVLVNVEYFFGEYSVVVTDKELDGIGQLLVNSYKLKNGYTIIVG